MDGYMIHPRHAFPTLSSSSMLTEPRTPHSLSVAVELTGHWYTKPLPLVNREVFLSVLRTFHRKSTAASTAIHEGPWAPNQRQRDYDTVVKAWRTEKGRHPYELPGLRPEDSTSRLAFWRMLEHILDRTPVELVDYATLFSLPFSFIFYLFFFASHLDGRACTYLQRVYVR